MSENVKLTQIVTNSMYKKVTWKIKTWHEYPCINHLTYILKLCINT